MKKHSSGAQTGLYVVGALVGLYLLGAALLLLDGHYFGTLWFFTNAPEELREIVQTIYMPLDYLLRLLFGNP